MNVEDACKAAYKNRRAVLAEDMASCYQCIRSFKSNSIRDWSDEQQTALCPNCGIDSVVPGKIDRETLAKMCEHWFTGRSDNGT